MSLQQYHAKRDFSATPEPRGAQSGEGETRRFVVQRHRARRLHYDFRLEIGGVLASWAVPKGPTLDPSVRSMAIHVEDHPIEYLDFEGVIPAGQYGGGDVIVWDRGVWEPAADKRDTDPAQAVAKGEIHFDLQGEKLRGRFVLVRTGKESNGQERWLMLHKHDEEAVDGWNPEDHPRSVKSGRTNDEVAADPDALWRSDKPASEAEVRIRERAPLPEWDPPTADELAALDAIGEKGTWVLQSIDLQLTNLNKVLFPARADEPPVTKRDLIRYLAATAPVMLPYLVDRPVNLHRYPNGSDQPGFWHKEVPSFAPEWLTRWSNEDADPGESRWYFVIDSPAALAWMGNYGALELHPWTSRVDDVRQPTYAYIDIDPGPSTRFEDIVLLARLYKSGLDHLGVFGSPKLTGQRGIHIWVPVRRGYTFTETRQWTEKLSRAVGATVPDLVSWEWEKSRRKGLARLDYTQNARNKTLVAPYSTRPAPGAPVSVPITWEELDDPGLQPDRWTVRTAPARLAEIGDPFRGVLQHEQSLPEL